MKFVRCRPTPSMASGRTAIGVSGSQASTERSKWFRRLQVFCNDPLIHLSPLIQWNGGEGYYRIMKHEGDRTVDVKR